MQINLPEVLAEVSDMLACYEQALVSNDVATLDALFWDSPHTRRLGATENLFGYAAIQTFRQQRPAKGLARTRQQTAITTFGHDMATADITFTRAGEPRLGRQSQTWVRFPEGWRVVAAHVSWMDV